MDSHIPSIVKQIKSSLVQVTKTNSLFVGCFNEDKSNLGSNQFQNWSIHFPQGNLVACSSQDLLKTLQHWNQKEKDHKDEKENSLVVLLKIRSISMILEETKEIRECYNSLSGDQISSIYIHILMEGTENRDSTQVIQLTRHYTTFLYGWRTLEILTHMHMFPRNIDGHIPLMDVIEEFGHHNITYYEKPPIWKFKFSPLVLMPSLPYIQAKQEQKLSSEDSFTLQQEVTETSRNDNMNQIHEKSWLVLLQGLLCKHLVSVDLIDIVASYMPHLPIHFHHAIPISEYKSAPFTSHSADNNHDSHLCDDKSEFDVEVSGDYINNTTSTITMIKNGLTNILVGSHTLFRHSRQWRIQFSTQQCSLKSNTNNNHRCWRHCWPSFGVGKINSENKFHSMMSVSKEDYYVTHISDANYIDFMFHSIHGLYYRWETCDGWHNITLPPEFKSEINDYRLFLQFTSTCEKMIVTSSFSDHLEDSFVFSPCLLLQKEELDDVDDNYNEINEDEINEDEIIDSDDEDELKDLDQ
jgi:hypothetical protein